MTTVKPPPSAFDVESFIREYYEAWSGNDEDRVLSFYTDDAVIQIPGKRMEGKEALRDQFVRPFMTAFPGNWHRVRKILGGEGVVTVEFSFEGEHKGPFEGHAASGAHVIVPGCGVYEYDPTRRQITAARIYFDVGTLLQTITSLPAIDGKDAVDALHLNEANLSLIINTIPTAAWTTRADGYCDFLNQRWLDYTGMTSEQAAGWSWAAVIHPDDRNQLIEYWQSSLAAGLPVEAEGRMRRFDGAYRWFLFRANPLRDNSGKVIRWYGTSIDIEDRKRGEEALRASELSWRQIVDNIPGFVATMTAMGEVEFLNRQTLEYFGKTNDEMKSWSLIGAVHPDDLPRVIEARQKSIETGEVYVVEHRCRRADGVYRWFQVRGLPARGPDGSITTWYLLLTDIEDLKQAERALQESESNLSLTLNTIPTFIAVLKPDGSVLSANKTALDYHGITLQEVQRDDFAARWFHPDDLKRLSEELEEGLKRPQRFECEYRALGKDGKYRWFLVRYNPLLNDQGSIERWYVTAFDIEDRKGAEEALLKSERQLRLLVETIPALVWRGTPEGELDYLSRRAVKFLGYTAESLAGGRWLELVHPDHRDATLQRWLQAATTGTAYEDEYKLLRADGQYRWIQSVGEPFLDTEGQIANWYGLVFDIEDRKRAEDAQARQAGVRADVSAAFSKPAHLGEILRGCMEAIVRHLDAAFARIWMLNNDEGMLELQASAGMYTRLDGAYSRIPVGDLKVGWIAREKKAHLTNDVMNDPRVHDKSWARSNGMVAFAGYPLVVEDRLIGVVALFARRSLPESTLNTLGSVADIIAQGIERKRAEESLRSALGEVQKSESRLRQVIDAIPALAWCNLPDGPNEFLNKGWHEYTGLTPEESHGWGWQAAFHPEDLPGLMEKWTRMLTSGEPDEIEARLRRHDGVYRWFLIRAEPFRDESGTIVRWYGTSTDIDDLKKTEAALRFNERNLRLITNVIPSNIHVLRTDGSVLYVNQAVLDYHGCTLEDVQREDYRDRFFHPEDVKRLGEGRREALARAIPFENEQRALGKDGKYRWFLIRYSPLLDEQGRIDRWYAAAFDIEDRKQAEAEIEQAYLRLAEAQRVSKTGSFITDLVADDHDWSEEAFRIFEFDPGTKVTVQKIRDRIHPDDRPSFDETIASGMTGKDVDFVFRIVTSRGALKHVRGMARVMAQVADRPLFIGALQDITESKVAEEALSRARAELAHMARVTTLSALTASISHEVNQPIAAAVTSAGACLRWLNRDQPDLQRAREAAMRIEHDGKRAAEIISHLKAFYRKDVSPERETVSVNHLVEEMLLLLRSEAERHSVLMRTDLAKDQLYVKADRVQLQQVLMNLMLNGMESMNEREGELKISTRREAEEAIVSVSDTGVGIPADKMDEIFNAFFTTKTGGTGMGLAISKTIIESHGGRLWADPKPERGATLYFTLPTDLRYTGDH
jgi:steroid delta-isomerase-like uncharacterized protein